MQSFVVCGDVLCYPASLSAEYKGWHTPRAGTQSVPEFKSPEERALYTCGLVILHRKGGKIVPDPASLAALYSQMWFNDTTGKVDVMSLHLVRHMARAYKISIGIQGSTSIRDILLKDARAGGTDGINWDRILKVMTLPVTLPNRKCFSKLHRAAYGTEHISTRYGGVPLCPSCITALFSTPPPSWATLDELRQYFRGDFVDSFVAPLFRMELQHILRGIVLLANKYTKQIGERVPVKGDTVKDALVAGRLLAREYGVIVMLLGYLGATHGNPIMRMAGPRDYFGIIKHMRKYFSGKALEGDRGLCDMATPHVAEHLRYFGWYNTTEHLVYSRTASTLPRIGNRILPGWTVDPSEPLSPMCYLGRPECPIIMETAMFCAWRYLMDHPSTTVEMHAAAQGFVPVCRGRILDAKTLLCVPPLLKIPAIHVINCEFITWTIFLGLLQTGSTLILYGNMPLSISGVNGARGIFADMVMSALWARAIQSSTSKGLISVLGGVAHRPLSDDPDELKRYAAELNYLEECPFLLKPSGRFPGKVHPAWEFGNLRTMGIVVCLSGAVVFPAPFKAIYETPAARLHLERTFGRFMPKKKASTQLDKNGTKKRRLGTRSEK